MRLSWLFVLLALAASGCSTFSEADAPLSPDASADASDGSATPPSGPTFSDDFERANSGDVQGKWGVLINPQNANIVIDDKQKIVGNSSLRIDLGSAVVQTYVGFNGTFTPLQQMQFMLRVDPLPETGKSILVAQLIFDTHLSLNVKVTNLGITIAEQDENNSYYQDAPKYEPLMAATWTPLTWTFDATTQSMTLRNDSGTIDLSYTPKMGHFSKMMTHYRIGAVYADGGSKAPQIWFDQFQAR